MTWCPESTEPAYGLHTCTVLKLRDARIEAFDLRRGDLLRSESGAVWATLDGRLDDGLITPDRPFAMPADGWVRLSALGDTAVLSIVTRCASAALPLPRHAFEVPLALWRSVQHALLGQALAA